MDFSTIRKILAVNLKHNFPVHMGIAVLIAGLTGSLCNITALDYRSAAKPIETFLCLTGPVLLVPVCLPEQNENIRDVICSKRVDYLFVCAIRVMYSAFFLAVLIGGFVGVMRCCESNVTAAHFVGGFASALFLGAVGFATAALSQNVTVGYMAALIYYLGNMGLKDKLGNFFLFSMYAGKDNGKGLLLLAAVVLLAVVFGMMRLRRKFSVLN